MDLASPTTVDPTVAQPGMTSSSEEAPPDTKDGISKRRNLRLLSLDGGGVRGLSSLLILDRLMRSIDAKNPPKPCHLFDMIGGTSTGGYALLKGLVF